MSLFGISPDRLYAALADFHQLCAEAEFRAALGAAGGQRP